MKPTPKDMAEAEAEIERLEKRAEKLEKNGYLCQAAHLRMSAKRMCIDYGIKSYD